MGQVEARVAEIPAKGTAVIVCRSGGRSNAVAQMLNTRGIDQATRFYETVFGWTHDTMPSGQAGMPDYTVTKAAVTRTQQSVTSTSRRRSRKARRRPSDVVEPAERMA